MNLYYTVFVWYGFIFITSSVHGLYRCYKCDGDDNKDCSLTSVPYLDSVELCDKNLYPDRTPMCRISVYFDWIDDGKKNVTNVYRTGCAYVTGSTKNECKYTPIGNRMGRTECWCNTDLCNIHMPGRWEK